MGVSQQVFVLYVVIVVLVIGAGVFAAMVVSDRLLHRSAEERVQSVAHTVAAMPAVRSGLRLDDPSVQLQPLAERVRERSDLLAVVVTGPDGIRFTHPDASRIGERVSGSIAPATTGRPLVETVTGPSGRSVRAVVPVFERDDTDAVLGLVVVAVGVDSRSQALAGVMPVLIGTALFSLLAAGGGAWWIARRVARQTFGMREAELITMYAHHDAVLHAIREGLLVVSREGKVDLINDAAQDLLGVGPEVEGKPVSDLPVRGALASLLASGEHVEDQVALAGERLVIVTQMPVGDRDDVPGAGQLGTVVTMRDHSEVMGLADELSATRSLAEGLRAQVHESANRLHTVVMLVEMGETDAAMELATGEVRAKKALTNRLVSQFDEPTLVALLLGKAAEADRRSVELEITGESKLSSSYPDPVDLVTIVGNLIDNAMDAALTSSPPPLVRVSIREGSDQLVLEVRDSGPGFSAEARQHAFEPGWSTKPIASPERRHSRGIGMALIRQVAWRRGGTVEIGNATDRSLANDGTGLTGAVVMVRLPLPEPEEGEAPQEASVV